ncbi:Di-copper centre-containing protein [Thozetella sp. PMI_491]|nr:Di-copper centre-containing protein [Thozetella sp. PMI_491]
MWYIWNIVDKLEEATMPKIEDYMAKKIAAGQNNGCTLETAGVRREWGDMTDEQRSDFINATLCLMNSPSRAPKEQFPGARNRFDDFVAYHMTNAGTLHDTIGLFPAHKYFLLAYETALRKECGYKGYHPYMNYDRYTKDPEKSALFNGNMTSMGGNGAPDPRYKGVSSSNGMIKSGGGGGCVTEGPFKDMVVSLGPAAAMMNDVPKNPGPSNAGSNPRCMRRDINVNSALGATANISYNLITKSKDINTFYNTLLTPPPSKEPYNWGVHIAGHYIAGGDPGGDPMCSPGDPIFYFHHAMLDRLWWIWQMQDPENRLNAVVSLGGGAPAGRKIDLKWLIPDVIPVLEAHDGLGGQKGAFCHVYV